MVLPSRKIAACDDAQDACGANSDMVRKTFANVEKGNL